MKQREKYGFQIEIIENRVYLPSSFFHALKEANFNFATAFSKKIKIKKLKSNFVYYVNKAFNVTKLNQALCNTKWRHLPDTKSNVSSHERLRQIFKTTGSSQHINSNFNKASGWHTRKRPNNHVRSLDHSVMDRS